MILYCHFCNRAIDTDTEVDHWPDHTDDCPNRYPQPALDGAVGPCRDAIEYDHEHKGKPLCACL